MSNRSVKNVWVVKLEVRYPKSYWRHGEVLTYRVIGNGEYRVVAERARRLAIREGAAAAKPVHVERGEEINT